MSDVDMKYVAYDPGTGYAILAYKNGNIDLFKNNTFYNIPDLKLKAVAGNKAINHIYITDGLAYLSTTIGIVVVNIEKREIKETYEFTKNNLAVNVYGLTENGSYFYAATSSGLYRANKNAPNLQAFSAWTVIDSNESFTNVCSSNGQVFAASDSSVYILNNNVVNKVYSAGTNNKINHLDATSDGIWISETRITYIGAGIRMNMSGQLTDSFHTVGVPAQTIVLNDGHTWFADLYYGLKRRVSGDQTDFDNPNGPPSQYATDIYAYNGDVLLAPATVTDYWVPIAAGNSGFGEYKNGKWTNLNAQNYQGFNDFSNVTTVYKSQDGTIYLGSSLNGLLIINPDGSYQHLKENTFDQSGPNPGWWQVGGLTFDDQGNLWVAMFGSSPRELYVRTTDGIWHSFVVSLSRPYPNSAARPIVDNDGQLWYICPGGGGVVVYNYGGTPDDPSDDTYRYFGNAATGGNLPGPAAYCIAKDKDDAIWVGTNNGIGIINCGASATSNDCQAEQRIVQYDQFAGYLYEGESVRAIAVDGANRKWVGTTNGVWLLSPDASKIVYRFTVDNSPLPSNNISKICIDPITGDVYIGTDKGMVSYRSTATEGGDKNENVLAFPNPVPSNYSGTIAIKGLVENADVRITDISGQLIYRTTALGGQAVWNGYDYTGRRPQSGVYLVFISNKDGSQKNVGKIVFMN
jgi:ligand-binding sensor domain-containing protein